LRADYSPAAGFTASSSSTVAHTVNAASTNTGLAASSATSTFGEPVTLTATVDSPDSPSTPTGTVTFRDGTTVLGTTAVDGAGVASLTTGAIATGSRTLTAQYNGAAGLIGSYAAGSTSTGHNVGADTATLDLVSSSTNVEYTDPVTFTATVTGTGGATPTGTVTFHIGATVLGVVALNGAAVAQLTLSTLPYG